MHTIYETLTGEIAGFMTCPESTYDAQVLLLPVGKAYLKDVDYQDKDTHYVSGSTIISRPIITATISSTTLSANAIDSIEISTLPIPCTITVNSETYEVTDGVFEFTVDTPGTYIIKATCFPYQPKEWEVTAE